MKKLNLDFIGEVVSSPRGLCSWSGSTISFWGKFTIDPEYQYAKYSYNRNTLIEAIDINEERPSKKHYMCSAFLIVPDEYLYLKY